MKEIFAFIGAFIILFCTLPYIIDVVKKKTKPNVITWVIWSVLIAIGSAALYASNEFNAALLLTGDFIATLAVVIVGLKYGTAKLDRFDFVCLIGAVVGLAIWVIFSSPLIVIITTIVIDLIATIPTIRHSYRKPKEETWVTYALGAIATVFTLLSLPNYEFFAFIYPAYLLFSNGLLCIIILFRRQVGYKTKSRS